MTADKIILAKITRPAVYEPVQRERLFALLDDRKGQPITWLAAPGGAGKSTLVASYLDARSLSCIWYNCDERDADLATFFSYMGLAAKKTAPRFKKILPLLTPEYLVGIPTFTKNYFETIYSRCKTIVLDNYQDVPTDVPFHDMIAAALAAIPDDVRVMIISRSRPPAVLSRLQAHDRIKLLEYNDLRFTLEESGKLIHYRTPGLEPQQIRSLHDRAEGWAAGIILMSERGNFDVTATEPSSGRVFDYFANEVFNRKNAAVQDFLLKTSFLPVFDVGLTKRLTGSAVSANILSDMNRHHFFTEQLAGTGRNYQYHPLFREFLLSRAKTDYAQAELVQIMRHAAALLIESGQMESAAKLCSESADWDSLVRLILDHAAPLMAAGRSITLEGWLCRLPADLLTGNAHLLYLLGVCRMSSDHEESRALLAQAFDSFETAGDKNGALMACSAIMDSYLTQVSDLSSMGRWLDWLDRVEETGYCFPSREMELEAASRMLIATFHQPWHPRIGYWRRKAEVLIVQDIAAPLLIAAGVAIILHYIFFGMIRQATLLLEALRPRLAAPGIGPFQLIHWQVAETIYAAFASPSTAACLHESAKGMAMSRQTGIRVFDALFLGYDVMGLLISGDIAAVEQRLQSRPETARRKSDKNFRLLKSSTLVWREMISGEPLAAVERIRLAIAESELLGAPQMTTWYLFSMALTQLGMGKQDEARQYLELARAMAVRMDAPLFHFSLLMADAWFAFNDGRETEGIELTGRAMRLGSEHGIMLLLLTPPNILGGLCAKALENGIEPKYVTALIRKHNLKPAASGNTLEAWPYQVKIRTLGRFEILMNDEPLVFSSKEQKKPLELLKALIACGGQEVPRERLTDALWPDSDGDLALKSFEMTLSRLRRLLGRSDIILSRVRHLSIDTQLCWVDSLALEHLMNRIQDTPDEQVMPLCAKAIQLHRGPFLAADAGMHSVVAKRETLKNRLLRVIMRAGRQHEQAADWEAAAEQYEVGIETDSLAEEFHRNLMTCHCNLGNHAAAVRSYHRCRSLLRAELGIEPSPATTAVYSSIVNTL